MRIVLLAIATICLEAPAQTVAPSGQTAIVTFYAPGAAWKRLGLQMITVGEGDAPSVGSIFDGPQHLGAISPGKFAAFQLPAGQHAFLASYGVERQKGDG